MGLTTLGIDALWPLASLMLAPFIGTDVYRITAIAPGFDGVVKILLGLVAGCAAVYAAARWRSR